MNAPTPAFDTSGCDKEPIHIPGSIQPHGALLVLQPEDCTIVQASTNAAAFLGRDDIDLGHERFGARGGDDVLRGELVSWWRSEEPALLRLHATGERTLNVAAHRSKDLILLEFEQGPGVHDQTLEALYPRVRDFMERVQGLPTLEAVCEAAARDVRRLTGFDRVLIYRFDDDDTGVVIAEDNSGALPGLLHHRFPASDIPRQARELYRLNRLRIIPDAGYTPVPIRAAAGTADPLDLTYSMLRSVSPVHLEYMRNMGTAASMSVSILVDGRLWGLISCHNAEPKAVALQVRASCDFLAQVLALQVGALERTAQSARRVELKSLQAELLTLMAQEEVFSDALVKNPGLWRALVSADGAALVAGDTIMTAGQTPNHAQIRRIVGWLERGDKSDVFATDCLANEMPEAEDLIESASGLVALAISEVHPSYILWFRPEHVRTIPWAGEPAKLIERDGLIRPRNSFALWQEQVLRRSAPWSAMEIEAARELREAVIRIVLRQAEEKAELTEELALTNRELEAFSYSISHDLRAPFRHIVGYAELLTDRAPDLDERAMHYLQNIREAALSAGRLVDDLLAFSQLGRATVAKSRVDMNKLMAEVMRTLEPEVANRNIDWSVQSLPVSWGDPSMLRQVLVNLVSNAVKYTRGRDPARIGVRAEPRDGETLFEIRDNGAGFDMAYVNKLFGVFQRLHRVEEFEGTGIGLAIVKRIVDRHGGRIWAEGELDKGAVFRFTLPHLAT